MKKGHTPKNIAPIAKANSNTITNLCLRQLRVLALLMRRSATLRELFSIAGNNPAETIRQLRKRDIKIGMDWVKGTDQDGKKIRYGIYSLDKSSKASAKALLRFFES